MTQPASRFRTVLVQHDLEWESPDHNLDRLGALLDPIAELTPDLVVLPEMFAVGFSMKTTVAEPCDGPAWTWLLDQARRLNAHMYASIPTREPDWTQPRNIGAIIAPDGTQHCYTKIHLFRPGGEGDHYTAGSRTVTVPIRGVRCTFLICYDLRFAPLWWATADKTDVYVICANWPAARQHHWAALLNARAIENQAFVVGVNRVGSGGGIAHIGGSVVISPDGDSVAQLDHCEQVRVVDLDISRVASLRTAFPVFADRAAPWNAGS